MGLLTDLGEALGHAQSALDHHQAAQDHHAAGQASAETGDRAGKVAHGVAKWARRGLAAVAVYQAIEAGTRTPRAAARARRQRPQG